MDLDQLYKIYSEHPVISTDSRNITPGSIFFALKGNNFNGDDFAVGALKQGAAYAVVSNEIKIKNERFILVDDTLTTLQKLANYHRKKLGIKILSITGSNGKTTTKELCKAVLGKKYNILATSGNLNNHIGVPLTILSITGNINFAIIEMGANHPGEIENLCNITEPDFGLITNVGKAHLEGFGSIEGVAKAKGEMFSYLMKNDKTIFQNLGNPYIKELVSENYTKRVPYNDKTSFGKVVSVNPFLTAEVTFGNKSIVINTQMVGKYNIENVIAATVVGNYFDVQGEEIKNAIENYIPDNARSQLIDTGKNKVILDAYNANPSSMKNAIENFFDFNGENKIVILGQMLELGEASVSEHQSIINLIKNSALKRKIVVGKEFEKVVDKDDFEIYENVEKLSETLKKDPILSSIILVKGSRGNRLEKILTLL